MARISLRTGLDRDVYQIVKKLDDEREVEWQAKKSRDRDGGAKRKRPPRLTVTAIYESIKKSNSSLSRQKRKPLEDAIERVLEFRREEEEESEDSDDLLEQAEEYKPEDRFLLNRQMTKHWNVAPAVPTAQGSDGKSTKKRRISPEPEAANGNGNSNGAGTGNVSDASAIVSKSSKSKTGDASETAQAVVTKKALKAAKYGPEQIPPGSVVLGGVRGIIEELQRYVFARARKPEDFACFGEQPMGILISGPPGTGKQSLVRSLSWRTRTPVISIGRYLSETRSPEKVSKIFTDVLDEAKKIAPCVVLFDHLDEYMTKSGNSHSEFDHEVISQLKLGLRRLREWEREGLRVVIVGTTSKLELVDPTLRRPDYFAQTITVKVPNTDAREEIFKALTRELDIPSKVDFQALAVRTHGFVGDDIRAVIQVANRKASDRFMDVEEARARNTIQAERMDTQTSDDNAARDLDDACLWYDYIEHPSYTTPTRVHVSQRDFVDAIAEHTPYMRREGFSSIPSTSWSEVGALHSVRAAFQVSIVRRIKEPLLFQKFGKQRPAGVLLFGPPGCGKTLVAKAVANDAQASFILIKGPELLNKYVGESERAIRELFTRAKSCAPCILFFDEMDSLVPKRENTTTEAGARVVNALLAELDGAGDRGEVYVIGTSNRPDMIDPAILRPGRLDKLLFVDLPTEDERVDILGTIVRNGIGGGVQPQGKGDDGDDVVDVEAIARDKRCAGFSGADLYGLYKNALDECVLRYEGGEPALIRSDWEAALSKTKPSVPNPETYRRLANKLHHQT